MSDTLAHGELLRISDLGVFIYGPAGIGKSTIALELLDRGHRLIADDVVRFQARDGVIYGSCPDQLHGYLALRDLGILDIEKLYGPRYLSRSCRLDLVISLNNGIHPATPQVEVIHGQWSILDSSIPQIQISVVKYRNVALVIETAVKNYILYSQGQDANRHFEQKQQYKYKS